MGRETSLKVLVFETLSSYNSSSALLSTWGGSSPTATHIALCKPSEMIGLKMTVFMFPLTHVQCPSLAKFTHRSVEKQKMTICCGLVLTESSIADTDSCKKITFSFARNLQCT